MCHACERSSMPTRSGCGNHVEQALAAVALSESCACDQDFTGSFNASNVSFVARHLGY
jgi:hypothetical protein